MQNRAREPGGRRVTKLFAAFADVVAKASGRPPAFFAAVAYIVVWALCGPAFGFSDTWQLIMNTASSIVTFVMVFIIQNSQARDAEATQAKLDELIRAVREADSRLIRIEELPDEEIEDFRAKYGPRSARSQ